MLEQFDLIFILVMLHGLLNAHTCKAQWQRKCQSSTCSSIPGFSFQEELNNLKTFCPQIQSHKCKCTKIYWKKAHRSKIKMYFPNTTYLRDGDRDSLYLQFSISHRFLALKQNAHVSFNTIIYYLKVHFPRFLRNCGNRPSSNNYLKIRYILFQWGYEYDWSLDDDICICCEL